ncbi:MAG: Maf family protein [Proteobacteria bacterium]|jgi:septum formation protein|nr:Maf family protein [Pseudomonadota bacterium]
MSFLYLASESPRRKELLQRAGFTFQVFPVKVSENIEENLTLDQQIQNIANTKLAAFLDQYKNLILQDFFVIAADTMVIHQGKALGKAETRQKSGETLRSLSGQWHQVKTALAVGHWDHSAQRFKVRHQVITSSVRFKELSEDEIQNYIASGEADDKAGSYGIQGKARSFVLEVEGPYDNIVGLPVEELKSMLQSLGFSKEAKKK